MRWTIYQNAKRNWKSFSQAKVRRLILFLMIFITELPGGLSKERRISNFTSHLTFFFSAHSFFFFFFVGVGNPLIRHPKGQKLITKRKWKRKKVTPQWIFIPAGRECRGSSQAEKWESEGEGKREREKVRRNSETQKTGRIRLLGGWRIHNKWSKIPTNQKTHLSRTLGFGPAKYQWAANRSL